MKLRIYHTNDIHSNFEAFAGLQSYLKQHKTPDDLLIDAGDFHDFKSIMISGTKGAAGSVLLEHCHYDAIAMGNNEGFSGLECVEIMGKSKVKLLSCNLFTLDQQIIPNVLSHLIIERNGLRILIIGLAPYFSNQGTEDEDYNKFFNMEGLRVENPLPLVQNIINQEKGNYDLCIALSHLGYKHDFLLADSVKGINLIIGGHSHTYMEEPLLYHDVLIFTANEYGKYLGVLDIEVNENKISSYSGKVIPNTFKPDEEVMLLIKQEERRALDILSQPLYTLKAPLNFDISEENDMINFLCDALAYEYPCDFAMINHGIVESGIEGDVSKSKLLHISPSPLNPTHVRYTGKQIKEALLLSFDKEHTLLSGRGAGFRGTHLGAMGLSSVITVTRSPFCISLNGKELEDDREYSVMTSDYLQRGSGYPMLKTHEIEFYSGYIRDVLERTLNNEKLHKLSKISRFN